MCVWRSVVIISRVFIGIYQYARIYSSGCGFSGRAVRDDDLSSGKRARARSTLRRPSSSRRRQISYTVSAAVYGEGGGWRVGVQIHRTRMYVRAAVHTCMYIVYYCMCTHTQTEKECKNERTQRTFRSCACACPLRIT